MEPVSRYCPECGQRARAAASKFDEPQVCPKCKSRVMFLEHPSEMPPLEHEGKVLEPEDLIKFDSAIAIGVAVGIGIAAAIALVGAIRGLSFLVIAASFGAFVIGLVGAMVTLDHHSKVKTLVSAYRTCLAALKSSTSKNEEITSRYYSFKVNFETILEEAKQTAQQKHDEEMDAAQDIFKYAARLRDSVKQYIGKATEVS